MRSKVSGVSQEVSQHLGSIASRFSETSEDLKARAARAAADLQIEQERIRPEAERLPARGARERREHASCAQRSAARAGAALEPVRTRAPRGDAARPHCHQPRLSRSPPPSLRSAANRATPVALDNGDRWTLGDLLARASREDSAINIASIAKALDPTTASAIWSRFRAGQRGIMVRSIYTTEGRSLFDDISARYKTDVDFRRVVDRFLVDFEWLIRDVEQKDPAGSIGPQSSDLRQRAGVSVPGARQRPAALRRCRLTSHEPATL